MVAIIATVLVGAGLQTVATPESAAIALGMGSLTITPDSGDAGTAFTLGSSITCPGDTAQDGYRIQSFVVPTSTSLDDLTFDADGPSVGVPLTRPDGSTLVDAETEVSTGRVLELPGVFTFESETVDTLPPGPHFVGVACVDSTLDTLFFWSRIITVIAAETPAAPGAMRWMEGEVPMRPHVFPPLNAGSFAGHGHIQVAAHASISSGPGVLSYHYEVTGPGGPFVRDVTLPFPSAAAPVQTFEGLHDDTDYIVTVTATNAVGESLPSAPETFRTQPPIPPGPELSGRWAGPGTVEVTWPRYLTIPLYTFLDGFEVAVRTGDDPDDLLAPFTIASNATSFTVDVPPSSTPVVTVTPILYALYEDLEANASTLSIPPPDANTLLFQNIEASRPPGALILEQDCGSDPSCTVDLGTAAPSPDGGYFVASGALNAITVTDTRDSDAGWTVKAHVAQTFNSSSDWFDARALGWAPAVLSDSPPGPSGYDQVVTAGQAFDPWASYELVVGNAILMSAEPGSGLGVARGTAQVTIAIPVSAAAGTYSAELTITVV